MTPKDIRRMSDEELLDMDYFLNEDLDDIFEEGEGFSSSKSKCLFFMPAFVRAFLFKSSPNGELSYKEIIAKHLFTPILCYYQ